jgi:uncharacterized membrane protein
MTKIERSIVIDRPVDEVFAFTHDLAKSPLWQSTLVELDLLTDGPMRVGTRWREVRRFLGKRIETVIELTEYEANRYSAIEMVSGPTPLSGTFVLEPVGGATRFTVTGELDAHGFFKLAEPVFAGIAGRELQANLSLLKALLEGRNAPTSADTLLSDERVLQGSSRRQGQTKR